MKRISIGLAATLATVAAASAQTYLDSKGTVVPGVAPLVGCASGGNCAGPVSATNPMPVTGSFTATLSGFQPSSAYATPLSVSTTSSRVALPAGSVVVVYNTGAAAAYVQLGGSSVAAATSNDVVPAGGWMAFSVGSDTYLAAISSSGTTTLNVSGGSGLPTGAGGGSSGGSGGTVTQGTAASASGAWPTYLTIGGAAMAATNGLFVNPATGATFPISGSVSISGALPAFASTPTVNLGTLNGAATAANQATAATAGSTTSAQTGNLDLGAVTSSAPTYATGTSNFLSLNTSGGLRVDGSGVTQPVSGSVSVSSLPALPAGSNTIGAISNTAFAATQSGSWSVGGLGVAGTPSGGVFSVQGVAGGVPQPVSGTFWQTTQPVSLSSLPTLPAGSNTVGNVGVNNNAVGPASFATSQASITATSSGVALAARTGAVGTGRVSVTIYNLGSATAYLGASTSVTASTGLPILPGGSYTKRTTAALYAVTASGSTTLAFDEEF